MTTEYKFWEIWKDPYLLAFIFSFNHGFNGDIAAKIGYLSGIVYSTNLTFTTYAMDFAAANGHLEVVKWLHNNRKEGCTTWAMDWAALNGHLDVIKWLHENRTEGCTKYAMDMSTRNGHLEVCMWLHENRTEGCTVYAMDWAVKNGHCDVIKWLHKNRKENIRHTYSMHRMVIEAKLISPERAGEKDTKPSTGIRKNASSKCKGEIYTSKV